MGFLQGVMTDENDMTWTEVGKLSQKYLRIPIILIFVELFYRFITWPRDTLAWIQVIEAHIWHSVNLVLFGESSSSLGTYNGWTTKVTLYNVNFPAIDSNEIVLYVSDECAGIHEILFLATLVYLTPGVTRKMKIRTIGWMSIAVFALNMIRLIMLYPIALWGCTDVPQSTNCHIPMWQFHHFVQEWGHLLILVTLWTLWFFAIGGASRINKIESNVITNYKVCPRKNIQKIHVIFIMTAISLLLVGASSVLYDEEARIAKEQTEFCETLTPDERLPSCNTAENNWEQTKGKATSLITISILLGGYGAIEVIEVKPNQEEE